MKHKTQRKLKKNVHMGNIPFSLIPFQLFISKDEPDATSAMWWRPFVLPLKPLTKICYNELDMPLRIRRLNAFRPVINFTSNKQMYRLSTSTDLSMMTRFIKMRNIYIDIHSKYHYIYRW